MSNYVAIDFETYLANDNAPVPKPVCLSFFDGYESGLLISPDIYPFLKNLYSSNKYVIAHNATFENLVIDTAYSDLKPLIINKLKKGEIICTQIYEQLLDIQRKSNLLYRFSLSDLVKYYYDVDISESKKNPSAWRLRYCDLDGIPLEHWPKEAKEYAISDSIWAFKIYLKQRQCPVDYSLSVMSSYWLNKIGSHGILVDKTRVSKLKDEITIHLEPIYQKLKEAGFVSIDKFGNYKKNVKVLQDYVSKLPLILLYTPKNKLSVSKNDLQYYLTQIKDPHIQNYLGIKDYEKIITSYIPNLENVTTVIRSSYNAVVNTGRTSCRTTNSYPSLNIQQIPREVKGMVYDVRGCIIPKSDYKFVSIDYGGLEMTAAAHQLYTLTGKSNMRDVLNSGEKPIDPHTLLGCQLHRLKHKEIVSYEHFMANKKKEPYATTRLVAKRCDLSFPGGLGYDEFNNQLTAEGYNPYIEVIDTFPVWKEKSLVFEMCKLRRDNIPARLRRISPTEIQLILDECVTLKREFLELYPDLKYFLKNGHELFMNGRSKKMYKHFKWENQELYDYEILGFKRSDCTYTEFCNGILMQSISAIGAKKAVCSTLEYTENHKEINGLAFIHDELDFEVMDNYNLINNIDILAEKMIDSMQSVLSTVRVVVEADINSRWSKTEAEKTIKYWKDPGDKTLYKS